ncbi:MAG: bifunctional adenosylcobinamide kinase/adenosylcobinamide-phosphate guanylyltransferase [Rhodopila sp.]
MTLYVRPAFRGSGVARMVRRMSVVLVLGGARSGKSRHAEARVQQAPPPWTYIATAEAFDDEMAERITRHQARRDARWRTIDAPRAVPAALDEVGGEVPVLVDCLTLWLSNLILAEMDVDAETAALEAALGRRRGLTALVSNEVGWGVVPATPLGRRFQDAQGLLNQRMAAMAEQVELVAAGLPLRLK